MNELVKQHMVALDKMKRQEKLEYAFTNFYEYSKMNNELKDVFLMIIANIFTNLPLKQNMLLPTIKDEDKIFIVDCAYEYEYGDIKGLRGPLLNTFGEILDSDTPNIEPFLDLMKMLTYNREMRK